MSGVDLKGANDSSDIEAALDEANYELLRELLFEHFRDNTVPYPEVAAIVLKLLRNDGYKDAFIQFQRVRPGAPKQSIERILALAERVEELKLAGWVHKAAIAQVMQETGCARSTVYAALQERRSYLEGQEEL
jgi:hypothetical protein